MQNRLASLSLALFLPATLWISGCAGHHHGSCPAGGMHAGMAMHAGMHNVTVVGQGEATGKPDIAHTSLGVEVTAATVDEAMTQANKQMSAIMDALKKAGIAENDMQTANFSIQIERPYTPEPPPPMPLAEVAPAPAPAGKGGKGALSAPAAAPAAPPPPPAIKYRVSNTIDVKIRDISKTSKVIQAAVDAGANNVWNVSFGIDSPKALEAQAREKAVADAKARASALAALEDAELGEVIRVSEVIGRSPIGPMPMFSMAEAKFGGGPPLAMGEVSLSMSIEVVYSLKKKQK